MIDFIKLMVQDDTVPYGETVRDGEMNELVEAIVHNQARDATR